MLYRYTSHMLMETDRILIENIDRLCQPLPQEKKMLPRGAGLFPSTESLAEIIRLVRTIVFPDFFDRQRCSPSIRKCCVGMRVEDLYRKLRSEISHALRFDHDRSGDEAENDARGLALRFIECLPDIRELLYTDVQAIFDNDPAVDNYGEVILCYPVVQAMIHYRTAHALLGLGIPVLPRMLTEMAHSTTGIDIHPGATIGRYFAIDHGTGVVIGETCVIGNHVTIYQGVTLGAKNFSLDSQGHPINIPRHPILEDNVTVYSNSSILGRITVGRDSIIGGNVWLTHSVPAGSRIMQSRPLTPSLAESNL